MRSAPFWIVVSVTLIIGCGGSGGGNVTAPSEASNLVSSEEMGDLTMASGQMSEQSLDAEAGSVESRGGGSKRFTRTRNCPAGGEITVEGVLTADVHGNVTEIEGIGTRTESDCAINRPGGVVTINGTAAWDSFHRLVGGVPQGLQTTHWKGVSTFTREDGSERTCRVEITITRNPSSGRRDLEGTICGQPVSRSGEWSPRG